MSKVANKTSKILGIRLNLPKCVEKVENNRKNVENSRTKNGKEVQEDVKNSRKNAKKKIAGKKKNGLTGFFFPNDFALWRECLKNQEMSVFG